MTRRPAHLLPRTAADRPGHPRLGPAVAERLRRVGTRRMDHLRLLFGTLCPGEDEDEDEDEVEARSMLASHS